MGVGLLDLLRMLPSHASERYVRSGITLIHPGMAAECTAGDIVTNLLLFLLRYRVAIMASSGLLY